MEVMDKSSNSSSSSSSARWNPTEQQVSVLEGLYRQGVRTPNAEQIHMITTKLREFGNIEAKNVFYWFQNHKARQRQRERQVTFNYYSSLLRRPPAPPPPPVICSPYYLTVPQYQPYPIHHAAAHTSSIAHFQRTMEMAREGSMDTNNKVASPLRACHYNTMHVTMSTRSKEVTHATNGATFKQTLDLFPLHPTGILEDKLGSSITCASMEESDSLKEGEEEEAVGGDGLSKPLYDFFGASHRSQ